MKLVYEGNPYTLDLLDMTTDDAREMYRTYEIKSLIDLEKGLTEMSVDAITVCYWLMLKQSGAVTLALKDVPAFKLLRFAKALGEAAQEEAGKAAAADPKM